jgi:hypothetical protein
MQRIMFICEEMKEIMFLVICLQIPLFHMRIADGLGDGSPTYLDPTLDHPLYMEAVEQALALCEEDAGPPHLKLVLEWDLQGKERYVTENCALAVAKLGFLDPCVKFTD